MLLKIKCGAINDGADPCLPGTDGKKAFPGQMLFIKREFITHLNFTPTD